MDAAETAFLPGGRRSYAITVDPGSPTNPMYLIEEYGNHKAIPATGAAPRLFGIFRDCARLPGALLVFTFQQVTA